MTATLTERGATRDTSRTPAGMMLAEWADDDGPLIDTAHARGYEDTRADVAQYLDPSTGYRALTVSVFDAERYDTPRAWRLTSGHVVASLTAGRDDLDLYSTDPARLAAALRAAADALDALPA